jgi:two-component system sensor histidine kinase CiaH
VRNPLGRQPGDAHLLRRVRWRLVAWSAGSTLVMLLLLGSAIFFSAQATLTATATGQLQDLMEMRRSQIAGPSGGPRPRPDEDAFGQPGFGGSAAGTVSYLCDSQGQLVGPHPPEVEQPVLAAVTTALDEGDDLRLATVAGTPVRVLSSTIDIEGEPYVIQILQDRTVEANTLGTLLLVLVVGGLAVLITAGAFGFLYAGRALVPIRESLRRQREFAADASHELRTPLTVIRGSVADLRRNRTRPVGEVGQALEDVEAEVQHLTRLVDDLLLLARSDSGAVEMRRERVELSEVTGDALQSLRAVAEAKGVTLSLDAAPVGVTGDPDRLRQLVAILVDNAIRYSPTGGTVWLRVHGDHGVELSVEDEGPGLRPEDLPHAFDRFWRAPNAPSGGTGLGLAIAAWIAEHHGGTIAADNRPAGGARFTVRLPGA